MYIKFALFIILWSISSGSYTSSTSASQCVTTESQSSSKWCRNSSSYTSGYSCTSSDTSAVCGGDSNYRCSSETSNLPQNSKKLLCPVDTTYCNTQSYNLTTDTNSTTLISNYFPTNTVCWYRFTPGVSSIKSIKIEIPSMSNANAEVYTETSTNVFNFQGLVASGNSLNVTIDNKNSVWVLVNPTANNAYAYVSAYASPYSSKSSSLSGGAIAAIVICILMSCLFHAYLIGIFALVFRLKINKSKGMENKKGTQENKNSQNPNNNQNLEENKAQSIHQKAKSYKYLDNTASVDKEHINIPPINNRPPNTVNNLSPYPIPEPFIYTPRGIGNGRPINSQQNHYIPYEPVRRLHQNPDRNVNLPEPPSNNV